MSTANCEARGQPARPEIGGNPDGRSLSGPGRPAGQPANDHTGRFGRVGIIGAHRIGIGIAKALLDADIPVTMFDKRDALDRGLALLRTQYAQAVEDGAITGDARDRRLALFSGTERFHHLKDADLILELMPFETDAREKYFRWLDEIGKPDAILAAHACAGRLDQVARLTRRPADVLGLDLTEEQVVLLRGRETSAQTVETVRVLLGSVGKLAS